MADGGANGLCSQELLDSKISRSLSEMKELEVIQHELGCLHAKSRVFTRQGAGNIFFLSDCALVTAEFKRKLDYSRKELAQLNQQKQEIAKS